MSDATESIAPAYRELLAVTGELSPGEKIFGDYQLSLDAKVDVRSRSGNPMMQVVLSKNNKAGQVSVFSDGKWRKIALIPIGEAGRLEFAIPDSDSVTVTVGGTSAKVPVSVTDIARFHGLGEWKNFERNADSTLADDDLTIKDFAEIGAHKEREFRDDLVFDIGFFDGNDTAYYLWRGYNVVAVEANPVLAARGASYFREYVSSGRLRVVNCAIGDQDGILPFYVNRVRPEWSSTNAKVASRGLATEAIEVVTIRPATLFRAFGVPYFVKIDIEGQDLSVIEAIAESEVKPKYVSFEVGPRVTQTALARLSTAGYTRFNAVDQSKVHMTVDYRVLPAESVLGGPNTFQFRRGSSGTFGERLGGPWLDVHSTGKWAKEFLDRAAARNADFEKTKKVTFGDWFDIHAMR